MRPTTLILALVAVLGSRALAEEEDPGWPRRHTKDGHEVIVYQPQIEGWEGYAKLDLVAAIEVTPKGAPGPAYGVLRVYAPTKVDFDNRSVLLTEFKLTEIRFPNVEEDRSEALARVVGETLPDRRNMVVGLDRILAGLERTEETQKGIEANLEPPPIHYSAEPAVLVMFLGEPRFKPIEGMKLQFAINTNWDVFLEVGKARYFLRIGEFWLTAPDPVKGPWTPAKTLAADLAKLPEGENWDEVRENVPGKRTEKALPVFVTTRPAELIVTEGAPEYTPIEGTKLLSVKNTESDLFLHGEDENHYVLLAGRWFRSKSLEGPWTSAQQDLPEDFLAIPPEHERGNVLASVAGSPEARDAVLLASVPRKATVKRSEARVTVVYEGDPQFVVIQGTTVSYAVNSPYDVFLVSGRYYCCYQGIWFEGPSANGPWVVCASVPQAIYTIPPTSPKHSVTYVYVYDSTPDTVVVGYTSGYKGQYVVAGALLFGLGYWLGHEHDDDHWHHHHYHYHSHYYGYGCGAHYSHYHGGYYRGGSRYYGPYGGAGRGAVYNPHTGTYARGAYAYGPRGGAYAREAYNPRTNTYGARVGGSTGYQSWGRSVVTRDDEWVRAGHRSGPRGTVGGIETSEGGAAVGKRSRYGSGFVAKDKDDNLYVGKDGQIYKRNDGSDNWKKYQGGGDWKKVDSPDARTTGTPSGARTTRSPDSRTRPPSAGTGSTSRAGTGRSTGARSRSSLNRSYQTRQRANSTSRRYSPSRRSFSAGSRGGRSMGGSRGGGGRRR